MHVTTTFSLKQGETRTSSGPIPHPLIYCMDTFSIQNVTYSEGVLVSLQNKSLMKLSPLSVSLPFFIYPFFYYYIITHCIHHQI